MKNNGNKTFVAYMFLLPALVLLAVFTLYPMIKGVILSFYEYNMIRTNDMGLPVPPVYVGIENYRAIFSDPLFFMALKNSILYLLIVPAIQIGALVIAVLLNRKAVGVYFMRTAMYLPVITSIVIVGIAWKWIFVSDGLLNFILVEKLHLLPERIGWLTDRRIALFSVMFVTLWQGLGYYMLLYLSGLQAISPEHVDAAYIDGANPWQIFTKITIPLIKPTMMLCFVISCLGALKVFGEIYVMTGGGPENSTLTMVYYIFIKGFNDFRMGYASALGVVFAFVLGFISYLNVKLFKEGGLQYY
ncbi:MAG: sugar ABC transporter permease [Candidatus Eremiobacteraeota bacterium]|nr:sugar ABC transporter permease [Candidatus Eremiobacteraeota bacterium]